MNDIYDLEEGEKVCCYYCQREYKYTEYSKGEAFLADPGHSPCDGNANYICKKHLDEDANICKSEFP